MQLVFTKGPLKYDKMDVIRDGVLAESIECPKQGIIPRDSQHQMTSYELTAEKLYFSIVCYLRHVA
jgi:hypothetical protein